MSRTYVRLSTEQKKKIVDLYFYKGWTMKDIADYIGSKPTTVRYVIYTANMMGKEIEEPKNRAWTQDEVELAKRLYLEGRNLKNIAHIVGRRHESVREKLKQIGLYKPKFKRPTQNNNTMQQPQKFKPAKEIDLIPGEIYKTRAHPLIGGDPSEDRVIKLVYEGKQSRHHMFRSKVGGWRVAYTDIQLRDLKLEV